MRSSEVGFLTCMGLRLPVMVPGTPPSESHLPPLFYQLPVLAGMGLADDVENLALRNGRLGRRIGVYVCVVCMWCMNVLCVYMCILWRVWCV